MIRMSTLSSWIFFCITTIVFMGITELNGQNLQSIHQQQYNFYGQFPRKASRFAASGEGIIKYKEGIRKNPSTTVFGYLPYWKYPEALDDLQFDLLSHIAVFDFSIQSDGSLIWPSQWPWTDLINEAHEHGVKVIATGVNFNGSQIHNILHNQSIKDTLFNQLRAILLTFNLQGVNIDFENIPSADRAGPLHDFMSELTNFLHDEIPGCEVSFASPPVNWGGWDFTGLANSCDYLFVMGYNFYGAWSQTTGPCAPLTGGTYNITNTVEGEYQLLSMTQPHKLILGVPYYGNYWKAASGNAYATALDHISTPTYSFAMNKAINYGLLWDPQSQSSYISFEENANWYQLWFDSDSSLGLKYDLAETYNYKGVGMWALGYDGSWTELWDELRTRYGSPSSEEELVFDTKDDIQYAIQGTSMLLHYQLEHTSNLSIGIYTMHGQHLWLSETINCHSGKGMQAFTIPHLASGIYLVLTRVASGKGHTNHKLKINIP